MTSCSDQRPVGLFDDQGLVRRVERHDRVSARSQLADQATVERGRNAEPAHEQQHTAHLPARGRGNRRVGIDVEQAVRHGHTEPRSPSSMKAWTGAEKYEADGP